MCPLSPPLDRLRSTEPAQSIDAHPEPVLLVHGLWTNRAIMLYLSRALAGRGFAPHAIGYYSALDEFEDNAACLAREIARCDGDRIHIVAHSLGGLVALRALARRPDARVRRMVLLGSPLTGCHSGRALARMRFLAPLLGTTRSLWVEMPQLDIPAGVQAGAIAGTRRMGLGSLVLRLPGPSDGAVLVEETRHPRLADHLVMPVAHSEMLISRAVAAQVAAFLAMGRFQA